MDLVLRKAMWPVVAAMAVFLAFASLNGGNFASPASAVIDTVLEDVDDDDDDEVALGVWWSHDEPDSPLDCAADLDLVQNIEPPDGLYTQDEDDDDPGVERLDEEDVIELEIEEQNEVWICVLLDDANFDVLEFDSDDYGDWEECISRWSQEEGDDGLDGACEDMTGLGTDRLQVDCDDEETCEFIDEDDENASYVAALFVCDEDNAGIADVTIQHGQEDDADGAQEIIAQFRIVCFGEVDDVEGEITCVPCSVEIVPALGSTQYSLIYVQLIDEDGDAAAPNRDVTWITDNCELADDEWADDKVPEVLLEEDEDLDTFDEIIDIFEEYEKAMTPENADDIHDFVDDFFDPDWDDEVEDFTFLEEPFDRDDPFEDFETFAATVLNCGQGHDSTPGTAEVCALIEVVDDPDFFECVDVTVIGGPATITVTADPTSVRCGERSQVTVTVKDARGANVSDHTLVEAVTNFGGVLGGTGAVAGQQGLVTPVSSTLAETIKGVATFWLLTSETHSGPYEIIVTTGGGGAVAGTIGVDEDDEDEDDFDSDEDDEVFDFDEDDEDTQTLGGLFSTGVLNGRVQVSCTIPAAAAPAPAATVRAPSTGQGIVPPNTGDAGLADASGSSWTLFVIGGAVAFALAGVAGLKFARR